MNSQGEERKVRPRDLALFLLACAIGVLAFWQSHQRWLDPIIDVGRDLYIPEQIAEGSKLYRDFKYNYPPLAPYLLALVVSVAGSSLRVYLAVGMVVALITAGALFWVSKITAGRAGAVLASALFFSLNFTSGIGYNYLFPYSHATVFAVMFLLVHLGATIHHLFVQRRNGLLIVALCSGLAGCWSRTEIAAIVVVLVIVATAVYRIPFWYFASFFASLIASAGFAHVYFADASTRPWRQMFPPALMAGQRAREFYARASGATDWNEHLVEMLLGAVLVVGIVVLLDRFDSRLQRMAARWRFAALALVFAVFLLARFDIFFRGWTLLQVLLIPLAVRQRNRSPLLLLLIPSALASARIYLNLVPSGYGFVFTVPLIPLILHVLLGLPAQRQLVSRAASIFWIPVMLAVATSGLRAQREHFGRSVHPIVTARGSFYDVSGDRAAVLNDFLQYMERRPKASGMVVLPEGLTLNYFAGVPNPLRYYLFTPVETAAPSIERDIAAEWSSKRPELVVELTRSLDEYGSAGFGVDYNRAIRKQLDRDYVIERAWKTRQFSLTLLRRSGEKASSAQVGATRPHY